MKRSTRERFVDLGSFFGALLTKLVPPIAQLGFIFLAGRSGGLREVGVFTTVSALAFMMASLAEAGITTAFSASRRYFDSSIASLVAGTRVLRLTLGSAGCLGVLLALSAGYAGGGPRLLWATPLPLLIGLGLTQSGALNRAGLLRWEGRAALLENALGLVSSGVLVQLSPGAGAIFAGMAIGRLAGVALRSRILAGTFAAGDEIAERAVSHNVRRLFPFAVFTLLVVLHGQADIILLGVSNRAREAGTYAPVMRMAYSVLLVAEAAALALLPSFSNMGKWHEQRRRRTLKTGVRIAALFGLVGGSAFAVLAPPVLRLLVGREMHVPPMLLVAFAVIVPLRSVFFMLDAWLTGEGKLARKRYALALAGGILLLGSWAGAARGRLEIVAGGRLASEALLLVAYVLLLRGRGDRTLRAGAR